MKHAILSLLVMTSTVTTVAVAQDGSGHGPPNTPVIIGPLPASLPTTGSATQPPSPPKLVSASTTK